MARLKLYLLGSFSATLDTQPLMGLRSNKTRALLAFLALEADQAHPRERLATLLWGEYSTQSAMLSLRVSLSNLRQVLRPPLSGPGDESLLTITREQVQFHSIHPDCWVDAGEFDALLAACFAHPHPDMTRCATCARRLERAMALYWDDLLAGLIVPGSAAFEEWRLLEQEMRHRQALGALEALAQYYVRLGSHDRARDCIQRQIKLEPWREEAHRDLMRLLALAGQPGAALSQYESLRRLLAEELNIEPAPETVRWPWRRASERARRAGACDQEKPSHRWLNLLPRGPAVLHPL